MAASTRNRCTGETGSGGARATPGIDACIQRACPPETGREQATESRRPEGRRAARRSQEVDEADLGRPRAPSARIQVLLDLVLFG